jgi:hypothetical protein
MIAVASSKPLSRVSIARGAFFLFLYQNCSFMPFYLKIDPRPFPIYEYIHIIQCMNSLFMKGIGLMADCKSCQCKDKTNINNNATICFFTILAPGNTFDPTRPGSVLVNGQVLRLGPITKKCKMCKCKCTNQECATLMGALFWTVSIPIFSSCAPQGSNIGFQSVSGSQIINQQICGDLSTFNNCNISASLLQITPKDPCAPDFQSDNQPLVGTFLFQANVSTPAC